jgi:O-succinylbenzoic acid--CoA ligase
MVQEYIINNKSYTKEQLYMLCVTTLQDKQRSRWEHIVSRFILDWFDESDTILQKTSGTTGDPKCIMLRKKVMERSATLTCDFLGLKKGDSALLCLPVDFIGGKMMVVRALTRGLNLIMKSPSSNPLKEMDHKIDFAAMVPLQVQTIIDEGDDLDMIKKLIIGGGKVTSELQTKCLRKRCKCYETFGMTETYSNIALREMNEEYFTTIGNVKADNDKEGKLVITAPFIQVNPIKTNDVAEIISNQQFKWLGRADHVINSGGIKIIPEQLEMHLENDIRQKFIFSSVSDRKLGEKLVLIIEGEKSSEIEAGIIKLLRSKLKKHEIPKEIIYLSEFPLTSTMKVNRYELKNFLAKRYKGFLKS